MPGQVAPDYRAAVVALERQARQASSAVLALMSFAACYGLLILEGQTLRPGFHFYPLIAGAAAYIAGDLLALVWFYALLGQLRALVERQARLERERMEGSESPAVTPAVSKPDEIPV